MSQLAQQPNPQKIDNSPQIILDEMQHVGTRLHDVNQNQAAALDVRIQAAVQLHMQATQDSLQNLENVVMAGFDELKRLYTMRFNNRLAGYDGDLEGPQGPLPPNLAHTLSEIAHATGEEYLQSLLIVSINQRWIAPQCQALENHLGLQAVGPTIQDRRIAIGIFLGVVIP
ncbi:hypothetical protein V5O48_009115 [Marasmius crinis-equi]|uniref:Uncharacterized protein n=1 Tax=Marasmius crinis-equi TaxID=585013 RepID=A0ABR3FC16_9AGAR